MGEPFSLSMRKGASRPAPSKSNQIDPNHSVNSNSPVEDNAVATAKPLRLSSLDLLDGYALDAGSKFQLPAVVIKPDRSIWSDVDWIDRTTWGLQGAATLGGVGLLLGRDDTLSQWAGTFMITTSASELLWEWIDRRHHLAHDHRLPRLAMSTMTGMLVSNLLVLGFGNFRAGHLEDPGRNPVNGFGP